MRWPIYGAQFNTRDYPSLQVILSDIEEVLRKVLQDRLGLKRSEYQVSVFSKRLAVAMADPGEELLCYSGHTRRLPPCLYSHLDRFIAGYTRL